MKIPKGGRLSKAQQQAFDGLEKTNNSYFIYGAAGSGKSSFIDYFRNKTKKNTITLTFTGLASILIKGQTIHSFFQLPPRLLVKNDDKLKKLNKRKKQIKALDVLIIDEISTVRCDLLNAIDELLRKYRENNYPFGGVQMLLIGDFFQIAPVEPKSPNAWKAFKNDYESIWFFDCDGYKKLKPELLEFTKIHRQHHDQILTKYLQEIRQNEYSSETLQFFNSRITSSENIPTGAIALCPTNKKVDEYNNDYLKRLSSEPVTYIGKKTGKYKESEMPTDMELTLKEKARVMMLSNDPGGRWSNGSFAVITSLTKDCIKVRLPLGNGKYTPEYNVEKELWEKYDYRIKKPRPANTKKDTYESFVIGSFEQYPIRIARATTIHKSQGQTFDEVLVDFDEGAFTHGQAYVALSRTRKRDGIYLKEPLLDTDIKFDPLVVDYYNKHFVFDKIEGKPDTAPGLLDSIEEEIPF